MVEKLIQGVDSSPRDPAGKIESLIIKARKEDLSALLKILNTTDHEKPPFFDELGHCITAILDGRRATDSKEVAERPTLEIVTGVYRKAFGDKLNLDSQKSAIEKMTEDVGSLTEIMSQKRDRLRSQPESESLDKISHVPFDSSSTSDTGYVLDVQPDDPEIKTVFAKVLAAKYLTKGVPLKSQRLLHDVLVQSNAGSGEIYQTSQIAGRLSERSSFPSQIADRIKIFLNQKPNDVNERPSLDEFLEHQFDQDKQLLTNRFGDNPIPGFPGCGGGFIAEIIKESTKIMWDKAIRYQEDCFDLSLQDLQRRARENSRDFAGNIRPVGNNLYSKRYDDYPPIDKLSDNEELRTALSMDVAGFLRRQNPSMSFADAVHKEFDAINFKHTGERLLGDSKKAKEDMDAFWLTEKGIQRSQPLEESLSVSILKDGEATVVWPEKLVTKLISDAGRVISGGAPIYEQDTKDSICAWFIQLSNTIGMDGAVAGLEQLDQELGEDKKRNIYSVIANEIYKQYERDSSTSRDAQKKLHAVWALASRAEGHAVKIQGIGIYDFAFNNITRYKLAIPLLKSKKPGPYLSDLLNFGALENPNTSSNSDLINYTNYKKELMTSFFNAFKREVDEPSISPDELYALLKKFGENKFTLENFLSDKLKKGNPGDAKPSYSQLADWLLTYYEVGFSAYQKATQETGSTSLTSYKTDIGFNYQKLTDIVSKLGNETLNNRLIHINDKLK